MENRRIVFDGGPLAACVARLLDGPPLKDKVEVSYRDSMVVSDPVMIVTDATDHVWSTGEEQVWQLLTSLAGRGTVNLGDLAAYVRYGTPEVGPWLVEAVGALFGVPPHWETVADMEDMRRISAALERDTLKEPE
jgi:hypothetical protein